MSQEDQLDKKDSEENQKVEESEETPKPVTPVGKRYRWLDQARGFVMLYLVITLVWPPDGWKSKENNIVFYYLFSHAGTQDNYMTVYDVGAAAFIFMLGFMLSVSYNSRMEKHGKSAAIKHFVTRYGILFILGILVANVPDFEFFKEKEGYPYLIVIWDVIISIAVAGIVSFPFIFIKDLKLRIVVGYIWVFIYQMLMNYAGFKEYAKNSVHGGIFGTIFGYAAISIIATAVGEYMVKSEVEQSKKYRNMLIFGLVNLIIGIVLAQLSIAYPDIGFEAAKRQVSFTHDLISIGATLVGMYFFVILDEKFDLELTYLQAFGMNPFLVYFLAEVPDFIIRELVGTDLGLGWYGNFITLAILLTYTSLIMMKLYKKRNVISTEKAALYFLLTLIILAAILLPLGVF